MEECSLDIEDGMEPSHCGHEFNGNEDDHHVDHPAGSLTVVVGVLLVPASVQSCFGLVIRAIDRVVLVFDI